MQKVSIWTKQSRLSHQLKIGMQLVSPDLFRFHNSSSSKLNRINEISDFAIKAAWILFRNTKSSKALKHIPECSILAYKIGNQNAIELMPGFALFKFATPLKIKHKKLSGKGYQSKSVARNTWIYISIFLQGFRHSTESLKFVFMRISRC